MVTWALELPTECQRTGRGAQVSSARGLAVQQLIALGFIKLECFSQLALIMKGPSHAIAVGEATHCMCKCGTAFWLYLNEKLTREAAVWSGGQESSLTLSLGYLFSALNLSFCPLLSRMIQGIKAVWGSILNRNTADRGRDEQLAPPEISPFRIEASIVILYFYFEGKRTFLWLRKMHFMVPVLRNTFASEIYASNHQCFRSFGQASLDT